MTKLLIVDDNEQNLYMLRVLLEGHGYEVVSAGDGAEALEKARRAPPDMIISDILMPVMDGFALCREWKKDEGLKAIPFVFYTATYTDPKDEEFALSLGAERFIVKPVEPDVFVGMLQEVIEEHEAGRLVAPREPVEEEAVYFREYNEALIRKLEDKMLQLEEANRALERELTERKRAEERIEHLNLVLRAIRGVNQLIVREKDRDRLIQGACDRLIETRGYYSAWIVLMDESGKLVATAEAGLGESFLPLVEQLERGEPSYCTRMALAQAGALIIEDPLSTCSDCPLSRGYRGSEGMAIRLEHGGKVYGLLTVSIPAHLTADEEERFLFKEVAGDIAFALHSIEVEEERRRAEEALTESEERYRLLIENSGSAITMVNVDGVYLFLNEMAEEKLGGKPGDSVGKTFHDLFPKDDTEEYVRRVRDTVESGVGRIYEDLVELPSGNLWFSTNMQPMVDADGKIRSVQMISRDITERKRAEEELRRSFEELRRSFEGTVHVLASAIEMRDPYTAGHQRRVTELACAIAKEMDLPQEQIEGLRMASLIHDLGKVTVPAEILSKPGRLSELEYRIIQAHPQVGYDVLKTTEFPWPVAQIVLQHHERMDGSGYPQGLSGEEIILEATILGVADVVEAMGSHRPYRSARGIDKALEEISQNRGILYDPEVVDSCLRLFTEKGFTFE